MHPSKCPGFIIYHHTFSIIRIDIDSSYYSINIL